VNPLISVCILAYNRAGRVLSLLDSSVAQESPHIAKVICEDQSPEREKIRETGTRYQAVHQRLIRCLRMQQILATTAICIA
jgi:glycosyltransferase involved in cell wall biosynthesis